MDTNRRSSKRQQKIPNHFQDSIHDLNKKKGSNKARGPNVMNKKDDVCLDQANREGLEEHDIQGDVGDKIMGCNEEIKGIVLDSEVIDVQNKDDGMEQGCQDRDPTQDRFRLCKIEIIRMCDGISNENGIRQEEKQARKSFVEAITQNVLECDKSFECIPTEIDENGVEVVVFDDVMVAEGCKRWDLTLCGFFVGYRMSVNELRYNLRRMWSKFGFKDIVDFNNGVFFMKFHHEDGLNQVVNSGPWMVKLCNFPLEAWTVKGISALTSRLGKPLVMDSVTANKCKQGIGMVRYARVIIEVSAKKTLANDVEIVYKNTEGMVQCRKNVKVEYDWKPPMCSECGVFGHTSSRCYKNAANIHTNTKDLQENVKGKVNAVNNDQIKPNVQKEKSGGQTEDSDEGFVEVKRKKNICNDNKVKRQNFRANPQVSKVGNNSKTVYQAKNKEAKSPIKNPNITPEKEVGKMKKRRLEVREIATKMINELKNVEIVDSFLHRGVRPTEDDMKRWSIEMIAYYKQKSEELVDKGKTANIEVEDNIEMEDVLEEIGGIAKCMEENVVKGCRIMVGWNDDVISIGVVHIARQSVLVKVETRDGKLRLYGSFIYASNSGLERKDLWKDLEIYKRIVGQEPWFLSGDLNVTLTPKEHSIRSSAMSSDMKDFHKCVNMIEVEDINSSGLFYTWTKNLHKNKEWRKKKPFKFANFITDKDELKALVSQYWGGREDCCRMFKIVKNLKGLKKHLKQLAWCNGDVFENVKKLREAMKDVQMKIDKDPNNHDLRSEEANVLKLYFEAMKDEEKILFQKARVKWLSVRDRNNAYFHKTIKSRQQRNRIYAVYDENGRRSEGNNVAEQFIKHFQSFLGESRHVKPISDMDTLFQCKLNSAEAEYMVREVSNEEIKIAMFQIDDNKAPGPDGYSATFFKKAWNIVGNDVCLAVKEFFETGKILREINSTLIALVPKIQTPLKV
ncbi:RNA-directed DNA polymerase, eukaryota, reverse transcriptase zinc-binding domain protein, partial [Tanacetum coccineum]